MITHRCRCGGSWAIETDGNGFVIDRCIRCGHEAPRCVTCRRSLGTRVNGHQRRCLGCGRRHRAAYMQAYTAAYYQAHRTERQAYHTAYNRTHRAERKAYSIVYYRTHRAQLIARARERRAA